MGSGRYQVPNPYILTASGRHFDLLDPTPDQVCIEDIAAALSKLCRFTGHTSDFYSVGQHCLHVMTLVPEHLRLEALLHDADEAYTGDVSTPTKLALGGAWQSFSQPIQTVVRARFGLPPTLSPEVKRADIIALGVERANFMPGDRDEWPVLVGVDVPDVILRPLPHYLVENMFTGAFHELTQGQFK
jgi:hypothetical protein